ncbi:hypothetical protein [Streptomyces sp. NBC_01320]|uniref:hypothetical protein n=1 Tax=Streptomyces sp. NBC_01320 TaxID=2903824 RepID=UPI002E0E50CB|nr:hypothetical protein OG395_04395 [Streptomyces sp. NBC_01320]
MTRTAALQPTARAARAATRRGRRPGRRQWAWAYLMVAPMTIGLSVFYLWPIAQTFYCSFTTSGPFGGHTWTGTANYNALTGNPTDGGSGGGQHAAIHRDPAGRHPVRDTGGRTAEPEEPAGRLQP